MADGSAISWTDATWNPVRGCRRVSDGCRNCYAERQAARFSGPGMPYESLVTLTDVGPRWSGATRVVDEQLGVPLRWTKPRRIFVDSMSDLFYEGFTADDIAEVFAVMGMAHWHQMQVLTKRAARARALLSDDRFYEKVLWAASRRRAAMKHHALKTYPDHHRHPSGLDWPLRNVWLGVSVENQAAADERIPNLLATPAAVRFISAEPLLELVDLEHIHLEGMVEINALAGTHGVARPHADCNAGLDWVIAGCESGPGARRCDVSWLRSLRDQCAAAGVPFFLKQATEELTFSGPASRRVPGVLTLAPVIGAGAGSKRKAGGVIELPYLDGIQHAAFPGGPT